ncbi:hypothetical protein Pmani_001155 [Petrolisthes manimaculis]|uniref:Uncharacterized protein n=1 Tax=Petrolisthes manimaculis TaxID=1843537 RepID=A0AAE1QNK6_9EUCA|nr:hypothetical protein Pmani_001155 [Petrolisthes manimaculis]
MPRCATFSLRLFMVKAKVTALEFNPAVFYRRSSDGNIVDRYGRDMETVKALARTCNFTMTFKELQPGKGGFQDIECLKEI